MRLLLAISGAVGGKLSANDDCCLEDGVVVFVADGIDKRILDGEVILLRPLDEARLVVLVGFDEFGRVLLRKKLLKKSEYSLVFRLK